MVRLYLLLFLLGVALTVLAMIGCLSAEPDEIRVLSRPAWIAIILFFPVAGAIAWFVTGRPLPSDAAPPGSHVARRRAPARPVAPEDDPDFLRSLDRSLNDERSRRDRELFQRWEEDLGERRRPDEEDRS